ncbi:DUF3747 domain-containing protein [Leptolyngbya sp. FACHB-261]|uniref:DUF3747 domain-containing protein n=1 Tax=Leptolyngbya sp. FACHB-261 TaxID=2692806 RepID=UPI001681CACB|nr:DUF3747 domain-containing protein [Leptolyngbya sp. FACHB-261]MBD2101394.1 DUF3747 domain-containing protein [Leptolyngbya sp. FACHB-261]
MINVSPRLKMIALATAAFAMSAISPVLAASFGQKEVDQGRMIAIAAPRGVNAHQLLVLEQVSDKQACWSETGSSPTLVDPLLLKFDFTGICGRSTDSNGYSIRMAEQDLGLRYSLRVVHRNGDIVLLGAPNNPNNGPEVEIGRVNGETNGFAKINLNPGWRFTKRTFEGKTLGHFYLTSDTDLASLPNPGAGNGPIPVTPSPVTPAPGTPVPVTPMPGSSPAPTPGTSPAPSPGPVVMPPVTPGPIFPGPVVVTPPVNPTNPVPAVPSKFRDIGNDVYAKEIEAAVAEGFVAGFSEDSTFRPEVALTREQLVSMVLEALGKLPNANLTLPTQAAANPYPDVNASRWSAAKIQFARDNQIVSGYQDGSFRPNQPVTRAELMAVLRRAAEFGKAKRGLSTTLTPKQAELTFSDTGRHWAGPLVGQMSSYCRVASPLNEVGTNFAPDSAAKRNYAAAATLRMLNCVKTEF